MKDMDRKEGIIRALCLNKAPGLPKYEVPQIEIVANHGVQGDYHAGEFVRHRYLAKKDPTRLNVRQVLLADDRIYANISAHGIPAVPGSLGENVVVEGIDLMNLPVKTRLSINDVLLKISEVREPCYQLNQIHPELQAVVMPDEQDEKSWRGGMMAVVIRGGKVRVGDRVQVVD